MEEYESEFKRLLERDPPPTAGDIEVMARKWVGKPSIPERVVAFRALAEGSAIEGAVAALDRAFAEPKVRKAKAKGGGATLDDEGYYLNRERLRTGGAANLGHALRTMPELIGLFRYDLFAGKAMVTRDVPNLDGWKSGDTFPVWLNDDHEFQLVAYLRHQGFADMAPASAHSAIIRAAMENAYHPVKDYLESVKWDGTKRVQNWLTVYLGAPDTVYERTVGTMFLVSMIARIYRPGCQADYVLTLEGPQGALKSTALRTLVGDAWFSDDLPDIQSKDAKVHLLGKWRIEIGELAKMQRAELQTYKAYITRRVDKFRHPYTRNEVNKPRSNVFAATTNQGEYLTDETGNRRTLPVVCGTIDVAAVERDRGQLFAEAKAMFEAGAKWWPERDFEEKFIAPEQLDRMVTDAFEEKVAKTLTMMDEPVTQLQLLEEMTPGKSPTPVEHNQLKNRLATALRKAGWVPKLKRVEGDPTRLWVRGPKAAPKPAKEEPKKEPERPPQAKLTLVVNDDDTPF